MVRMNKAILWKKLTLFVEQKGRNFSKSVGLSIDVSGSEYTFVFRERKDYFGNMFFNESPIRFSIISNLSLFFLIEELSCKSILMCPEYCFGIE